MKILAKLTGPSGSSWQSSELYLLYKSIVKIF